MGSSLTHQHVTEESLDVPAVDDERALQVRFAGTLRVEFTQGPTATAIPLEWHPYM